MPAGAGRRRPALFLMSTFPPYADAFVRWACHDVRKAAEILERHPKVLRSTNGVGETVLHYLAVEGKTDAVALLIAKGADVNTRNRFKGTPLHDAAQLGHIDVVRALLAAEAEVDPVDHLGETPLHKACRGDTREVVEILLKAGADPNAFSGLKRPLDLALEEKQESIAERLRAAGAVETVRKDE